MPVRPLAAVATLAALGTAASGQVVELPVGQLVPPNLQAQERAGSALAVSDEWLAVGSPAGQGNGSGRVSLWQLVAGTAVHAQDLTQAAAGDQGDRFGASVAVHGGLLVVGVPGDDDAGVDAGAAWVYALDGGAFQPAAKLVPASAEAGEGFGTAVALGPDGNDVPTVLVGGDASDAGVAVFAPGACSGCWLETPALLPGTGGDFAANFGAALALTRDGPDQLALVGAPGLDSLGYDSGGVWTFRRTGSGPWIEEPLIEASDGATVTAFGRALASDGVHLLVGADTGSAYVYARGPGGWGAELKLTAGPGTSSYGFGRAVAVGSDRLVVGASSEQRADVFAPGPDGGWQVQRILVGDQPLANPDFAAALALHGDVLLAGAPGNDDAGNQAGTAWRFEVPAWGVFSDLGGALAGAGGAPSLDAAGTLLAGDPLTLTLTDGPSAATGGWVLGLTQLAAPFKGGVLLPHPDQILGLATDSQGQASISASWPPAVPSGASFYVQAWIADAGGPAGFAASNGLEGRTP